MSDDKVNELRALLAAATPGPWETANGKGSACVRSHIANCAVYLNVRTVEVSDVVERWKADAALIAAAVNELPALLDQIEAVTRERDEARGNEQSVRASMCTIESRVSELLGDLDASRAREARLREALEEIAALDPTRRVIPVGDAKDIARAALAEAGR